MHATLGIHTITWDAVISRALDLVIESDSQFRRSVRPVDDGCQQPVPENECQQLLSRVFARLTEFDLANEALSLSGVWPPPKLRGCLTDHQWTSWIDVDTTVAKRSGVSCRYEITNDADRDGVSLQFNGKVVTFPSVASPSLGFLIDSDRPFAVGDIPGELDAEGCVVLAQTLVREGLLTVISDRPPPSSPKC